MQNEMSKLSSLEEIVAYMHRLLAGITVDLEKSTKGNKAASQRVRTGTVKLEKVAKLYRKESIVSEKGQSRQRGKRKAAPAPAKSKMAAPKSNISPKAKAAPKAPSARAKTATPALSKGKVKTQKASVKPKALAVKKPTAKLPSRTR